MDITLHIQIENINDIRMMVSLARLIELENRQAPGQRPTADFTDPVFAQLPQVLGHLAGILDLHITNWELDETDRGMLFDAAAGEWKRNLGYLESAIQTLRQELDVYAPPSATQKEAE